MLVRLLCFFAILLLVANQSAAQLPPAPATDPGQNVPVPPGTNPYTNPVSIVINGIEQSIENTVDDIRDTIEDAVYGSPEEWAEARRFHFDVKTKIAKDTKGTNDILGKAKGRVKKNKTRRTEILDFSAWLFATSPGLEQDFPAVLTKFGEMNEWLATVEGVYELLEMAADTHLAALKRCSALLDEADTLFSDGDLKEGVEKVREAHECHAITIKARDAVWIVNTSFSKVQKKLEQVFNGMELFLMTLATRFE